MILPTTYASALVLLVISFLCLGSWPNTYRLTGTRWRFELFSVDFAIGAILLSVIAAFTLGSLGSDLAFSDRMLVAGRAAQAFGIAAGAIFALGNMLLLAAVSLLGLSVAFPLGIGLAVIVASCFRFQPGNIPFMAAGVILLLVTVLLVAGTARMRERAIARAKTYQGAVHPPNPGPAAAKTAGTKPTAQRTAKPAPRPGSPRRKMRRTSKGLLVGILGGIALGCFYPVAAKGVAGDFGLGPYAGMLMFSIGVLLSTIVLNFYFLNISIDGDPLSFRAYFKGKARQHFLGFGGGALLAGGLLAAALADFVPQDGINPIVGFLLPLASVLLVILWGVTAWKEFARSPKNPKLALGLTAVVFAGGLVVLAIGMNQLS